MLVLSNIPPSKIPVPESPVSAQSQRRGKSPSSYVSLRHLQLGLKPHSHPWTKHLNKWAWQQTRRILRNPNDTELKSNWLMLEAVSVGKNQWELCQKQLSSENLKLQMNSSLLQPISRCQQLGAKQLDRNLKQVKRTNFSFKILADVQKKTSSL